MFSVDDELKPPEIIFKYRKKITESDGIIFVTPEYNHSIPGVLKTIRLVLQGRNGTE